VVLTAGMRNNNPGNIKYIGQPGATPSVNLDQGDPQAVFASPEAGMSAMYQLMMKKYQRGLVTPNQMIADTSGWTPGNKQAAANIARSLGINADDPVNLTDPAMAHKFMRALMLQEHGDASSTYGDEMIDKAIGAQPQPQPQPQQPQPQAQPQPQQRGELQGPYQPPGTMNHKSAFATASSMLGKTEGPDHAAVMDYLKTGGQNLDPATTAWCAAFVNSSLQQAGYRTTGSDLAKSFENYGAAVTGAPQQGDIAVFNRGDPRSPYGHVGFIQSYDPKTGQVQLLAGNQGNAVSVRPYDLSSAVAIRRPMDPNTPTPQRPNPTGPQGAADAASPGNPLMPAATPGSASSPEPAAVAARDPTTGLDKNGWRNTLAHLASGFKMPAMAKNDTTLAGMAMPTAARVDTPEMPTFDPNQIAQQRQNLALAMQRLNSGRLS
jgi:uncharacterized protein (TIGR02594 family)